MAQQKIYESVHEGHFTSDDVLGKDVIDSTGEFLGVVDKIYIDPNKVEIIGISIDKGFLKKGLEVGKDYIERIAAHAIFLRIKPHYQLKGKIVFDIKGEKIGKVADIILNNNKNELVSLLVKTTFKKINITANLIDKIGDNILLNIEKVNILNK